MSCAFPRSPTAIPLDKETDLLGPHLADSHSFFDQCMDFDTFDNGDSIFPALPELPVIEKSESESESAGTSSSAQKKEVRQRLELPQGELEPWGYRSVDRAAASPIPSRGNIDPSDNMSRAECLENNLLSLNAVDSQPPQEKSTISTNSPTPISTITPTRRISFLEQNPKSSRRVPRDLDVRQRSPIRTFTCLPKVMGTSYNEQNLNEWRQLVEEAPKFDFGFSNSPDPLSPPPSARISDASSSSINKMVTSSEQPSSTFIWDHPLPQQYASRNEAYLDTPITTPTPDLHSFAISNAQTLASDLIFTSPHQSQDPSSWPQNSSFNYGSVASSFLPDAEHAPMWWNPSANTSLVQAVYTRSASAQHNNATVSLASSNNNMHLPTELSYSTATHGLSETSISTGLMIQMPNSPAHPHQQTLESYTGQGSAAARMQPLGPAQKAYFATSRPGASCQAHPQAQPHLTITPQHQRHNTNISISTSTQPSRKHPSHPHQPTLSPHKSSSRATSSSSPSPKSGSPAHFHVSKRRSASRRRRKSEHSSPAGGAATAATNQGASSVRPGASESRSPRTPKSGSADNGDGTGGGGGGAIVDFVNFTPSDSIKILTGVAPSGSSKTKARREKEALEKRRRLSQAAMRAVQAAGGNIDALVEEGFLV